MEDNKQNLNNETAESVSGGAYKDWTQEQKKAFKDFFSKSRGATCHAMWIMREFNPADAVKYCRRDSNFNAEKIDELKKALGLS